MLCFREHRFRGDHVEWILRDEGALTLVEDGRKAATAAMMLLFEGHVCRVLSVAVAPKARRGGIGTQMMQAAEAVCRERGLSTIRLGVSTKNLVAIEFYRRLGCGTAGVWYGSSWWGGWAFALAKA